MSNYEIEDFIETYSGAKFFPHLPNRWKRAGLLNGEQDDN